MAGVGTANIPGHQPSQCGVPSTPAAKAYFAIPMWVILTCGKFKAEHCRALRKHMAVLCNNAALTGYHGVRLSKNRDADAWRSCQLQAAVRTVVVSNHLLLLKDCSHSVPNG